MQIIKQNQLDEVVQSYLASTPTKPLLVWFEDDSTIEKYLKEYISKKGVGRTEGDPMWGHKQAVVNGEFVKISEHPELLANDIYTESIRNADWVLYYRYTEQPVQRTTDLLHKPAEEPPQTCGMFCEYRFQSRTRRSGCLVHSI